MTYACRKERLWRMSKTAHGGNIYKKARELGISEKEILDFSANISPLGLPEAIKRAMIDAVEGVVNYPDPDCARLREAISEDIAREGIAIPPEWIVCGNGGADLLYRLAFGLKPRRVLLPVPAFVEYEEALTAAGAVMCYYRMGEDFTVREDILERITEDIDLVVLCNPNNPTGLLTERALLLQIAARAKAVGAHVLVDECFLEICEREAAYTLKSFLADYDNLILLKSFTKLYAIPGVRLGYLLSADAEVLARVNRAGQAWSVSHLAQCVGVAALGEADYKRRVIEVVAMELRFLKEELSKLPVVLYDGAANYLFFRTPGIWDLDARLEKQGIMIRNCGNYVNLSGDYWRVAVKSHAENERLLAALRHILGIK